MLSCGCEIDVRAITGGRKDVKSKELFASKYLELTNSLW